MDSYFRCCAVMLIGGDTQDNEHYLCSWISEQFPRLNVIPWKKTRSASSVARVYKYLYIYMYYVAKKMDVYYQYPKNMVPNVLLNSVNKHCHCQRINGSRYVESFGIWGFLKTIEERIAGGTNRPLVLRRTHIMDGNNWYNIYIYTTCDIDLMIYIYIYGYATFHYIFVHTMLYNRCLYLRYVCIICDLHLHIFTYVIFISCIYVYVHDILIVHIICIDRFRVCFGTALFHYTFQSCLTITFSYQQPRGKLRSKSLTSIPFSLCPKLGTLWILAFCWGQIGRKSRFGCFQK